ncbi:hypothetical protein ANN_10815 [Periplaneta americana]|uniref:Uncharacterized protein n=1 Tax=Periplaneta americana TaxID=6978 RepID=A0ABQ8T3A6_PERAM|nr:hypothetical protein ANN_10815 [Periplaneta americana]
MGVVRGAGFEAHQQPPGEDPTHSTLVDSGNPNNSRDMWEVFNGFVSVRKKLPQYTFEKVHIPATTGFALRIYFSCAAQQLNASQSTHRFSFVNHTIKTVNMPKVRHSVNLKSKLTSYISEFKEDGLSTDNKILFCNLCQCAVSSTQKFLVQQHITTSKHQANKQLNSKQRQLFLTQPTTSNVRSEFNIDLCRSLISADIPLYKLKNKVFREFLENILNIQSRMSQHLGRRMLHPSTMRQYRR